MKFRGLRHIIIVLLATAAPPVLADVKSGVDAWQQGDYARAINEWKPLATAGDPDAQFNMGQAYKLGRGVPTDLTIATEWFRKASAQGHLRAEDNYGLLLFQSEKRAEAMPYIQKSAARGEPRAQYILGTALFNGENIGKDWVHAYALMTRASTSGLPQASASLAQMDKYIPLDQRQKGLAMATQLEQQERSTLASLSQAPLPPAPIVRTAPGKVTTTSLPPSDITPPVPTTPVQVATPAPTPSAPKPAVKPPVQTVSSPAPKPRAGDWRIQLGAFGEEGRARSLWTSLVGKIGALSGYQPYLVKGGNVTRLQAGPLASQLDAEKLCKAVRAAGTDCLTKRM